MQKRDWVKERVHTMSAEENEIRRVSDVMNPLEIIANYTEEEIIAKIIPAFKGLTEEEVSQFMRDFTDQALDFNKRMSCFLRGIGILPVDFKGNKIEGEIK
jgi:hypothetical protein